MPASSKGNIPPS